uniref:Fibronectin type-III domain-containing protein n=1 Tax=Xiphophorus couchianus TaxID=32473 RepID=A0A3B5LZD2_9TELE
YFSARLSMASFQLLLFLGYFATAQAAIGIKNHHFNLIRFVDLDCFNDYDNIFCRLGVKECSQYTLIVDDIYDKYNRSLEKCNSEQCCCCSTTFDPISGTRSSLEKLKSVSLFFYTVKPKTPTIVSVDKTEGIFTVYWKTHMSVLLDKPTAEVTISKIGTQWKVRPNILVLITNFQINSQDLEPDTNYTVSVRSYTLYSHNFSDISEEFKFETSSAPNSLLLWIIISLSIFGVILIVSIYICFVNVSGNSSGGSSDLCYGQTEPLEPKDDISDTINKAVLECLSKHFTFSGPPPGPQDKMVPLFTSKKPSSVSSGIVNRSYFMSLSKSLDQSKEDSSTVEFPDNSINSCKSDTVDCPDQQIPAGLLSAQKDISSVVQVDMSYQQFKADANQTPLSENSSLSSTFSGTTTATSSGFDSSNASSFKRFDEANPDFLKMLLSSSLPSGTRHCPVVADDYKPFPNKVEQPGVLPSENQSIDHQGLNVIQGEKVLQTPQPCFIPDLKKWNGPSPSVLQIPHLTLLSSDKSAPVIIVGGYKCV